MRIGVVMPTYNQVRYLEAAVASVKGQSLPPERFVVVDDASTDTTALVLMGLGVEVLRHPENYRCAVAINTGIALLQETRPALDAYSWVSSDNIMRQDWLEKLSQAMTPDVGAVYSSFEISKKNGTGVQAVYFQQPYREDRLISSQDCYFGPSFLIRAEVWDAVQDHRGGSAHDYDHWARVEEECWRRGLTLKAVPTALCWYRCHPEQYVKKHPETFDAKYWWTEARRRRA